MITLMRIKFLVRGNMTLSDTRLSYGRFEWAL